MKQGVGSGSGSISQRYGCGDPDPDPHQNFTDPQHWFTVIFYFQELWIWRHEYRAADEAGAKYEERVHHESQ